MQNLPKTDPIERTTIMKRLILTLTCLSLIACGGDNDLEDKIDLLQSDGIKTDPPPPDKQPIPTNPARDPTRQPGGDHTPSDDMDTQEPDEQTLQPARTGRIAFESDGDIYTIKPDGTGLRNITNHRAHESRPAWGPDGKIAFVSNRENFDGGGVAKIYVMDADGNNQRLYVDMTRMDDPEWSPHGGAVIFTASSDKIHIGGNLPPAFIAEGWQPAWSVLGKIAFVRYNGSDGQEDIYVQNTHGGDPIRLTSHPGDEKQPAWSPDGRFIAYAGTGNNRNDIYVMNADGSNAVNLTNHPGDDLAPDWSPDGRFIAFMSNRDETFNWEIYIMNADGSAQRNLTNNTNAHDLHPSWQP